MAEGIKKVPVEEHLYDFGEEKHNIHRKDEHKHGTEEPDPHIWLSPKLLKKIAENSCRDLSTLLPEKKDYFRKRLSVFKQKIEKTDDFLRKTLAPCKGKIIFVFHPAFGYLTSEYGLKQCAVQIEGKNPSASQLARLIKNARDKRVKIIFVQKGFDPRAAEALARSIGGAVVQLDPLSENILQNLKLIARKIKKNDIGEK